MRASTNQNYWKEHFKKKYDKNTSSENKELPYNANTIQGPLLKRPSVVLGIHQYFKLRK